MSDDATFTQHIQEKCSAMKSKISWVLRTFRSRARVPMLTLWKTQVLCHLDYCSQLWSPHRIGSIQMLEAVQKTFYSKIDGMYHLSYWQQLAELKTYSLERRRERYRILYLTEIHMTFSTTLYQLRYIFFIYRSRFNIPVVGTGGILPAPLCPIIFFVYICFLPHHSSEKSFWSRIFFSRQSHCI